MTDDVYTWVRAINFTWAFILFLGMIYFGVQDQMMKRQCSHTHVPPEFELWILAVFAANLAIILSLAEIFLKDVTGGWRVFAIWPFLVLASFALNQGAFRVKMHRASIRAGHCK